ncbi:MAG TPA: hypothetical protein PKW08_07905 [Flavobacteriaceae bacterium]|nr:hypothetical protein [Flavobacteriaceae bacterium]MCB9213568.1 hypothetical protein [Alteromonas sp.]HPF12069.1 hypothetical protein [Flavobacteriaceae bacterium]HQU21500.1 hypothetical protein [Flavobacteriaceae bacterium]HQU65650.1 hypothetical protein [Flavobacteriaceae bacterium]
MAQEKKLFGKVANEREVEGIHILNASSKHYSITDAEGNFFITAKPTDTLVFSSVNFMPKKIPITKEVYDIGFLSVTLTEMVNELAEVYLGPNLSGDLERDIKKIPVEDALNFDDVGIPGFKGKQEEKIPKMIGQVITPTAVNLEALYKHLSGYYKMLRTKRKWEAQNITVAKIMNSYSSDFFVEAYQIPEDSLYDFLLFCLETSPLQENFDKEIFTVAFDVFEEKSVEYRERLMLKKENRE